MQTQSDASNSAFSLGNPLMVQNARAQSQGKAVWLEILLFLLVFLIASTLESILYFVPLLIGMFQTDSFQSLLEQAQNGTFDMNSYGNTVYAILDELPVWVNIAMLFSTVALIVTTLFYCNKLEKRRLNTLGLTRKRVVSEYLLGLLIGLVLFTIVWGLNLFSGGITLLGVSFKATSIPVLLLTLIGYFIQGASEEILCRGYLCVSVARRAPLWVGLLLNSIVFALLHLANSGISPLALLNLFLFGVFMTIYMIRRGNLWGACAIHGIWNFAQGNLFGLPVSGIGSSSSVLSSALVEGKTLWNGGDFGPEGGLCVTFVLVVAILLLTLFCRNQDAGQTAWVPVPKVIDGNCQK